MTLFFLGVLFCIVAGIIWTACCADGPEGCVPGFIAVLVWAALFAAATHFIHHHVRIV